MTRVKNDAAPRLVPMMVFRLMWGAFAVADVMATMFLGYASSKRHCETEKLECS